MSIKDFVLPKLCHMPSNTREYIRKYLQLIASLSRRLIVPRRPEYVFSEYHLLSRSLYVCYVQYTPVLLYKESRKKKLKRALKNFVNIRTSLLSLSCLLNAHSIGHTHNMNNDFGRKRMYGKERNLNPNFIRLWKAHNSYLMIFEGK